VYCPNDAEIAPFVVGYLSSAFGGVTEYPAQGSWEDDNDEIITEDVTVVESVTDVNNPADVAETAKTAAAKAKDQDWHDEDCIMWEVRPITAHGYE
jgi:hypothetical protein